MKALYFDGQLALREVEIPRPGPEEALVKVRLAGLCGTDREILKGYSGFRGILGHEFVGEVVECRSRDWIGKRVVGEINVSCGECEYCLWGLGRHCPQRTVMGIVNRDGALAEYLALPVVNLHEVPEEVSDRAAVFTEPLAAAAEILEQLGSVPARRALVLGGGRLGLLVAQVLATAGVRITVGGRHPEKLQRAKSWGMEVMNLREETLPAASFALVVEATGSPEGLTEALRVCEPRGTVVMKSTFRDLASFDTAKLVVDEINLVGSRCGNFSAALNLLAHKRIRVEEMISQTFPLEAGLEAFEFLRRPSCMKVLLQPTGCF